MPLILPHNPLVRATVINFFFCCSLNGFFLLPLYIHQLGGSEVDIGLVMSLYSAAGIVSLPLLGLWVDTIGRRPFMVAGIALVIVSALLATVANAVPWLGVVRALQGLAYSSFSIANFSYVIDVVPLERRGWALGIYGAAGLAATALTPLVGEFLIRRFGFVALFLLCAALGGVAALLLSSVRERRRDARHPVRGPAWVRMGVTDLLHRHMVVTFFFGLGAGTIYAFVPTFAESLGVRTLALFYTAYASAALAVRFIGGALIDTRGRRAVIVPSMFVQAAAAGVLAAIAFDVVRAGGLLPLPVLVLAGLLSGAAHGYLYPALAAIVADQAPVERRAAVVGVFSAVYLIGNTAGAFFAGYLAHALGYGAMWAVLTAVLLAGGSVSIGLDSETVAAPARA